jgi:hypothetical protein
VAVPPPPDPYDPLLETWKSDLPLARVHRLESQGTGFNPSASSGRFRPVRSSAGLVVPTMYAASSFDAALSETAFHELPVKSGPKHLARSLLEPFGFSRLRVTRPLTLVSLRGHGLRRLGIRHGRLIECGPASYAATAAWGQAAYEDDSFPDGLVWVSRQYPGGLSLMLFGDRCSDALQLFGDDPPLPLVHGRGFEILCEAASEAGVVIVER